MNKFNFLVTKETVFGPNIKGQLTSYRLRMVNTGFCKEEMSLSLDDLKKIAAFLEAFIEKEKKQEGGER